MVATVDLLRESRNFRCRNGRTASQGSADITVGRVIGADRTRSFLVAVTHAIFAGIARILDLRSLLIGRLVAIFSGV